MQEPGLDEHEWASRWEALEEDVRDAPAEALPELDDLVAEMMAARGLPLESATARTRPSRRRCGSSRRPGG